MSDNHRTEIDTMHSNVVSLSDRRRLLTCKYRVTIGTTFISDFQSNANSSVCIDEYTIADYIFCNISSFWLQKDRIKSNETY